MKVIALLTARGNNTLKNKNLLKILNKPLIAYPCMESKKVKKINDFYVSSEDLKILKEAKKYKFKTIKRPKNLSKPNSLHQDVLKHSIRFLEKKKIYPELILVLLGNAPIIKSKWIKECINIMEKNQSISSIVPVIEFNDHHPLRAKKIKNGFLKTFINGKKKVPSNRQDLEKSYFLCHNFWLIRTDEIKKNRGEPPWNFMGKKVMPYVIKKHIDVHDWEDMLVAEYLIKNIAKL